jgi:polysaccharide pyruvyl transferase WcaK-like protein
MSFTIIPCNTRCLNMGDVAMLQVAVARLRALWPWEELRVFTSDPVALRRYCPGVTPVLLPDQPAWCTDHYVGGRLHTWLSEARSERLADLYVSLACRAPRVREKLLRSRAALSGHSDERETFRTFVETIAKSRLVVVSGAGGIADHFHDYANLVLLALQVAQSRGIPTAILSHGFGPLFSLDLRVKAAAILPKVDVIALREDRNSLPLLEALGVPIDRVITTGDDAVELAYQARPTHLGRAVGVNMRLARSAAATEQDIDIVREGLRRFASRWAAPHLPLPIARQRDLDMRAISRLTMPPAYEQPGGRVPGALPHPNPGLVEGIGAAAEADAILQDGRELDTPLKVIHYVARCRIVVTGAYHAAVFALSQGVPAVCVARSPYFVGKFLGLADQFGGTGCHLVSLDEPDVPARLLQTMEQAWNEAPRVRETLWSAAEAQIERGRVAYDALRTLIEPHTSGRQRPWSAAHSPPSHAASGTASEAASSEPHFARATKSAGSGPSTL